MKNLKSLKESLLSKKRGGRELTAEERKTIKGGYYATKEECLQECHGGDTSGWNYYTGAGYCEYWNGTWDCYDS